MANDLFRGIPTATNGAHLTVVTEMQGGERNIYNFRVVMGKGSPTYASVQITPDVTKAEATPPDSIAIATINTSNFNCKIYKFSSFNTA
ncbi:MULTISPECIES: hypothetical protein [Fischerella]|uniref:hypothetical protein n=1 Tax=Fischerella TaxID=1190 RepID=UPI00030F6764|nr:MULTISPECIES: hypothetical protein [Fischerella]MBD2434702.1 hypothetical protein [Fischerella sp. FACHB-380]